MVWLKLTKKRFVILLIVGIISVLIHNLFYAIFGFEEAVFFIIAVFLIPLYFLISVVYMFILKRK